MGGLPVAVALPAAPAAGVTARIRGALQPAHGLVACAAARPTVQAVEVVEVSQGTATPGNNKAAAGKIRSGSFFPVLDELLLANGNCLNRADATAAGFTVGHLLLKTSSSTVRLRSNWVSQYFVLPKSSPVLYRYKSLESMMDGEPPTGTLDVVNASVFLKAKSSWRFKVVTTANHAAQPQVWKLRSNTEAEYTQWLEALRPHAPVVRELTIKEAQFFLAEQIDADIRRSSSSSM